MGWWQHYKALMFKNSILWRRRLVGSIAEILFTVFMIFLIYLIREVVSIEEEEGESRLEELILISPTQPPPPGINTDNQRYGLSNCKDLITKGFDLQIGLGPSDVDIYGDLEIKIKEYFNDDTVVKHFASNDALDDYITSSSYGDGRKICAALIFDYDSSSPKTYKYHVRFNSTELDIKGKRRLGDFIKVFNFEGFQATDELLKGPSTFQDDFVEWGFLQMQVWVTDLILKRHTSDSAYIVASVVPMYIDDYVKDEFIDGIAGILAFFIVIAYAIPVCRMISLLVQEKEYRTHELMSIMGLNGVAYWLS